MKKKIFALLFLFALCAALALNAYADKAGEKKETLGRLASRIAEAVREL